MLFSLPTGVDDRPMGSLKDRMAAFQSEKCTYNICIYVCLLLSVFMYVCLLLLLLLCVCVCVCVRLCCLFAYSFVYIIHAPYAVVCVHHPRTIRSCVCTSSTHHTQLCVCIIHALYAVVCVHHPCTIYSCVCTSTSSTHHTQLCVWCVTLVLTPQMCTAITTSHPLSLSRLFFS